VTGESEAAVRDLKAKPLWPLPPALMWVAFRQFDLVAERMAVAPSDACVAWTMLMVVNVLRDAPHLVAEPHFEKALRRELADGSIIATGLFNGNPQRTPLPRHEWEDLDFSSVRGDGSAALPRKHGAAALIMGGYWTGLRFPQADLIRVFRPYEPPTVTTGITDEEAQAFLRPKRAARGGFIPQDEGADILRDKYQIDRPRGRALTRALTGNTKTGPRGPRK